MFEGKVIQVSHERGLLVSFEGSSPALGSTIVDNSGNILGRVETVLGNINEPLVHIHPVKSGIVANDCIGKNVKIRARNKNDSRGSYGRRDGDRGSYGRRDGDRGSSNRNSGNRGSYGRRDGDRGSSNRNSGNRSGRRDGDRRTDNKSKPNKHFKDRDLKNVFSKKE